ncbi:beta-lactamase family protein [Candidatus Sumerlaeota bacterium]|nr:beta-lactamase family protein [Candidatus Sumerlaeota bacterium]
MTEKIDTLFQDYNQLDVPGACVAAIKDGDFLLIKSYGLANIEQKIAVSEFTNFRIASVTKQFTAMAIMILKQSGDIDYEDAITKYFSGAPKIWEQITIRRLLSHTSGLVDYEDLIPPDYKTPVRDCDVLELLKTRGETYFTPGTQYKYSNTGYAFLALIVEKVSGKRFATFMKENIFDPLEMENTVVFDEGFNEVKNRAFGYREIANGFEFADQSLTSSVLGDGGIYASIMDYFRWDQALYGEKLVRDDILKQAFTPQILLNGASTGYGFGWRIDENSGVKIIHHNGSTCGFSTAVRRIPEQKFSIVIFTNRSGKKAQELADKLLDQKENIV